MMNNETPADPSDDFIAILGTVPQGPRAGYPQLTIPMGYNATTRRTVNISVNGNAYSERNLIGVAYVIEQATKLRQPASEVNPSMYRCAKTIPAPPFASRGDCNPDYDTLMKLVGTAPTLPFSLETESAKSLQDRMTAGTLTAETLVKAYLTRIALLERRGPGHAGRPRDQHEGDRRGESRSTRSARRRARAARCMGIPVLLDDSIDVDGLPTTGGSIALQNSLPKDDSTIVAKLKAAGAIILGKTNVSELDGLFDGNMPEGYSSLGGQVMLPSDTDKTPAGSSGGSAAATASGLAALTVGMETSTDTAQLIAPAGVAGVVGLKPTVGLVSRDGVLPGRQDAGRAGPDRAARSTTSRPSCRRSPAPTRRTRPRRAPRPAELPDGPRADRAPGQEDRRHQQHDRAVPDGGRRAPGRGRRRRPSSRSARRARTRRASSRASSSAT